MFLDPPYFINRRACACLDLEKLASLKFTMLAKYPMPEIVYLQASKGLYL